MFLRYLNSYTIRSSITHLSLLTRRTQLCSNCTQKFMINSLLVKTSLPLSQHHFIRQQATTTTTTQPSQFDYSSNNDNKNVFHRIHSSKLDLDSLLERLDGEAHRRGRLTPGLVNEAIRKATIELEYINPTQALLLIRCSGSLLLGELPIQRQQVLEQMMNVFKTKNVQFDITHYNSYMRVCLQNSHYFDPDKILNDIKIYGAKSNIQPNLTTYKLFMECYAKQGRSNDAQKVLELMKQSNFNIESHTLTCLIESYAQQGNYDKVQQLFQLFDELTLKPISQTYEQFVIVYFKQGQFLDAKKYFILNSSKMDNDTFYRLLILSATYNQHDMFQLILDTIDKNVLADTCIQYILYTAELLSKNLDDYAFMLIKTFPERDETLRFDVLNYTFLNLLKIRLPIHHFKPFSSINIEQRTKAETSIGESEYVRNISDDHKKNFQNNILNRTQEFTNTKDCWTTIHQLLFHSYLNFIPLPYLYLIYDVMKQHQYEYRPHYIRPLLIKIQKLYSQNSDNIVKITQDFISYIQKNFTVKYDNETLDIIIDHFLRYGQQTPIDIDSYFKQNNFQLISYWSNLYNLSIQYNMKYLNSLKVFLTINKHIRFDYNPIIRNQTSQIMEKIINQLSVDYENNDISSHHILIEKSLHQLIDFLDVINQRFVKNQTDIYFLNNLILRMIVDEFLPKETKTDKNKETIERTYSFIRKIVDNFYTRRNTIKINDETLNYVHNRLGLQISSQNQQQQKSTSFMSNEIKKTVTSGDLNQYLPSSKYDQKQQKFHENMDNDIYMKQLSKKLTIRELEDHLIELKHKKLNIAGVINKLLSRYCTECLDGEKTLPKVMFDNYFKRIDELETIYFDKTQISGYPSPGVIAILIDYYSRINLNLEKVTNYMNLTNELYPEFKLDPHKCVSVIRLLINKNLYDKAIELIEQMGKFDIVPQYMYRRVRDLLLDSYHSLSYNQYSYLVDLLIQNNYVDPSATVLSVIVRKCYEEQGPLPAFDKVKNLLLQYNNLICLFPIIRKLLRDDCTDDLKQVLVKIGKIRTRTYAYEQLAFALIHEGRLKEAVRVCQHITRSTFDEHCQRYVRELLYFPSSTINNKQENKIKNHDNEVDHVFDTNQISLINFLDYIEQYPTNSRHISLDTLFYSLFKAYEKMERLNDLKSLIVQYNMYKYSTKLSDKTKQLYEQANFDLTSSPPHVQQKKYTNNRFLRDKDYEDMNEDTVVRI